MEAPYFIAYLGRSTQSLVSFAQSMSISYKETTHPQSLFLTVTVLHQQRTWHICVGQEVLLEPLTSKKEDFLANQENKQTFSTMLSCFLEAKGYRIFHSKSDADLLIVKTATKQAAERPVVVIGEDVYRLADPPLPSCQAKYEDHQFPVGHENQQVAKAKKTYSVIIGPII